MIGPRFRVIDMPVHRLQAFRAIVLGGQAIIQTEEDLLGYPLFFSNFKSGLDQMSPQRCADVVCLLGGFAERIGG